MTSLDPSTVARMIAADPEWVAERRRVGAEWFEKLEAPTGSEEEWRYVALPVDPAALDLADSPGVPLHSPNSVRAALTDRIGEALIVDGHTVTADHDGGAGLIFAPLARALVDHEAELRGAYMRGVDPSRDRYAAAHATFSTDGVFLYVPRDRHLAAPLVVETQSTRQDTVAFPHVTIVVESGAEASLVLHHRSAPQTELAVVPQIEVSVRDGARLRLTNVQDLDEAAVSVAHQRVVLGRDATVLLGEAGLGSRFGRLDLAVELLGMGGSAEVLGLYFGEHEQVLDYRLTIEHHGPHTTSNVFLKGAVEDEAQSVFTGMVRIHPTAEKTSAFETNRNLVLSPGAKANSVPNLEILCNDVICGHASTVGPLDEDHLYYLGSRGLPADRAARLLVRGFFEEVIGRLPHPQLAESLRQTVNGKFAAALEEGRV